MVAAGVDGQVLGRIEVHCREGILLWVVLPVEWVGLVLGIRVALLKVHLHVLLRQGAQDSLCELDVLSLLRLEETVQVCIVIGVRQPAVPSLALAAGPHVLPPATHVIEDHEGLEPILLVFSERIVALCNEVVDVCGGARRRREEDKRPVPSTLRDEF